MKNLKRILLAGLLAGSLGWVGCVVTSVYPFYRDKDVVTDDALAKAWARQGENETWTFARTDSKAYDLTVVSNGETTRYRVHLFRLKGQLLLDLYLPEPKDVSIPPHLLMRVDKLGGELALLNFSNEWLVEHLKKNPGAVRHVLAPEDDSSKDKRVVLTASTPELQRFVARHLKTTDAWKDEMNFLPAASIGIK